MAAIQAGLESARTVSAQILTEKYTQLKAMAASGGITFRVLSFAGGVAMVANGVLGVFANGGFMNTLINCYEVAFGMLAVALEGKHEQMPESLKSFLFEWCHLVTMLTGRGILYMLIGGIITAAKPWTNLVVGLYVVFIGVVSVYFGWKANQSLDKFQNVEGNEASIRADFLKYDDDGDNALTFEQFITFLASKGVTLTHNEAEAAAARFDQNFDRRVDLESFVRFYKGEDKIFRTILEKTQEEVAALEGKA